MMNYNEHELDYMVITLGSLFAALLPQLINDVGVAMLVAFALITICVNFAYHIGKKEALWEMKVKKK